MEAIATVSLLIKEALVRVAEPALVPADLMTTPATGGSMSADRPSPPP